MKTSHALLVHTVTHLYTAKLQALIGIHQIRGQDLVNVAPSCEQMIKFCLINTVLLNCSSRVFVTVLWMLHG